ncbi:RNA polymerase sigma factor [Lacimicrobium alkaliphilum]|uniref:RNA polymerase subunit sigma-24 n=1 Tax=Lacimicrobium alkaliphilum TaxID=1526571 RepID=A0A0U3ACI6_9ALTE|nr:RNA polymerase sigma factor [Lacimicrobium alkaliphilum]ALS98750.1 RNA polymerase subunit sigma-24 [Lacimicrobium alkaliphilum]
MKPSFNHYLNQLYRQYSRQVLATLIRLLGDFQLAEEAMQEAFAAAMQQWPQQGTPDNPKAWLIRAGRNKGIDAIRRRQYANDYAKRQPELTYEQALDENAVADDMLRLIFTCCHPGLSRDAQLALTLREVCGLTTEQLASGLLVPAETVAQRIVRAKRKIKTAGIAYEIPQSNDLPQRLRIVLDVIYLVFNEGYSRSDGDSIVDSSLASQAIELATQLTTLLPQTEVYGLLALMLLHDARKSARQDLKGDLITLEEQDRNLWDKQQIKQGTQWLLKALLSGPPGIYSLQAAIAAVHAESADAESTDWAQIIGLYDRLLALSPTPVVALNRAVAVAMGESLQAGLQLLDQLSGHKAIQNYYLYHSARAELLRRDGQLQAARGAYERALNLTQQGPEKRYLQRRLQQL